MSESNNNIPMRITQLEEATAYEEGMVFAVAKAGSGTKKIKAELLTNGVMQKYTPTLNEGYFVNSTNGSQVSNASWSATNFIDSNEVDCIYNYGADNIGIAYYNENFGFISGQALAGSAAQLTLLEKPNNCKWVRFSNWNTKLEDSEVFVIKYITGANLFEDGFGDNKNLGISQKALSNFETKNYEQLTFPYQGYLKKADGQITSISWAKTSEYIPVELVSHIYTNFTGDYGLSYYKTMSDSSDSFISSQTVSKGAKWWELEIPDGANYFRFTVCFDTTTEFTDETAAKAVLAYGAKSNTTLQNIKTVDMTTGYYVRTSDGSLMPAAWCSYSDFVDLDSVSYIYTCSTQYIGICYFSADKGFISGFEGANNRGEWYKLEPPANAKYVRFSCNNNYLDNSKVLIAWFINDFILWTNKKNDSRIENLPTAENIIPMYDDIICIGDSLTWSQVYTADYEQRRAFKTYPQILASLCGGITSHAYATPGDTAILWWERSSSGAFDNHGLYIVFLGTNGGLTDTIETDCVGTNPDNFANTNTGQYGRILQTIYNNGDRAVLIKPWAGLNVNITKEVVDKFALKYSFAAIDINTPERSNEWYHKFPDGSGLNGLHFNDLGYAWMANEIKTQINLLSAEEKFKIMRPQ